MWKYYVLRWSYAVLGRLPLRVLYGIARIVGDGAYLLRGRARRAVLANMRQVMGPEAPEREVRTAAREVFRNTTRHYADLFHIPHMDVQRFRREKMDLKGLEYLRQAMECGRGAVLVGAHFGNPEMAVQGVAAAGFPIIGFSEPLKPQKLSEFTDQLRSRNGIDYRTVGFAAIKEAIGRLKRGGLVAVLLDRDVGGTGVPMQFCGAEASIPLGGVDLALRTGAYLLPCWAWRLDNYSFRVRIGPPLDLVRTGDSDADIRANAKRVLTLIEKQLRSDPGQWTVLEPIWQTQKGGPTASSGTVQ